MRSFGGHRISMALSIVVLPAPVPPVTSTLALRDTSPASRGSHSAGNMPLRANDSRLGETASGNRMLMAAPCGTSGAMTACTRRPSTVEASAIGQASSSRRPSCEHNRTANSRIDCADGKHLRSRHTSCMPWPQSAQTVPSQVTAMSVTPGCEAMALRGPSSMLHPLAFQRFLQFIRERGQGFDGLAVRSAQAQAVQQFTA
jgi:hypothetical protein